MTRRRRSTVASGPGSSPRVAREPSVPACVAVPFVSSFEPSERAKAAGAPVEVDICDLKPGEKMTVEWRGKPVWIVRRTPEQLAELPKLDTRARRPAVEAQPRRAHAAIRAQRAPLASSPSTWWWSASARTWAARPATSSRRAPQPSLPDDWAGGFLCPCHGSTFDLAGRVFKNKPAPDNLEVPPLHVPVRQPAPDRRRQEGLSTPARTDAFAGARRMAEMQTRRPTPAPGSAADLGRQPLPADQALERARGASTTRRRTSTSGTSSARWRCWCW